MNRGNGYNFVDLMSKQNYQEVYIKILDERKKRVIKKLSPGTNKQRLICYYGYKLVGITENRSTKIFDKYEEKLGLGELNQMINEVIN